MRSLRARLVLVWAASILAAGVMAVLLVQLADQSASALAARADIAGQRACERLAERYAFYTAGWDGTLDDTVRHDLAAVAQSAGVPGGMALGFWHASEILGATPLAPPAAETASLADAASEALSQDATARRTIDDAGQSVLLLACPIRGPLRDLVGWARVGIADAPGWSRLRAGIGVLLALVLGISAWLSALVLGWNRGVARVEAALGHGGASMPRTGFAEMDRLVGALELAQARLVAARDAAAANERLAALGRVAAGVAHEIRNPVAAMRLGAENALAADPARRGVALEAMLGQIARLDRLIGELLEMTQRRQPQCETVALPAFLARIAPAAHVDCPVAAATFDPGMVERILVILLDNAERHAPGSAVTVSAADGAELRLRVADAGPGVPAVLRTTLFEPFVTGRADGTGLGLAIARELVHAHGGTLRLIDGPGAIFEVALWPSS